MRYRKSTTSTSQFPAFWRRVVEAGGDGSGYYAGCEPSQSHSLDCGSSLALPEGSQSLFATDPDSSSSD